MNKTNDPSTVAKSVKEIAATHPELHRLLGNLAEVLSASDIDPESDLAAPAAELVAAFAG